MFLDRIDAGRQLARRLLATREESPVVLGLPRGGLPVALEVARALGAPLDVLVSRKLGAPESPEYGIGAIAEGGAVYLRDDAVREIGLSERDVAEIAEREGAEVERRVRRYRGGRPPVEVRGRTVILVDDGIATGGTARAAVRALRERGAARVVLAVPVVARRTAERLAAEVDALVFVEAPEDFYAVGQWYEDFRQTSDEEVEACLAAARAAEDPDASGSRPARDSRHA
jgi:putative phosphoribosyl transferase